VTPSKKQLLEETSGKAKDHKRDKEEVSNANLDA
jgi:hypothetical protein